MFGNDLPPDNVPMINWNYYNSYGESILIIFVSGNMTDAVNSIAMFWRNAWLDFVRPKKSEEYDNSILDIYLTIYFNNYFTKSSRNLCRILTNLL